MGGVWLRGLAGFEPGGGFGAVGRGGSVRGSAGSGVGWAGLGPVGWFAWLIGCVGDTMLL